MDNGIKAAEEEVLRLLNLYHNDKEEAQVITCEGALNLRPLTGRVGNG